MRALPIAHGLHAAIGQVQGERAVAQAAGVSGGKPRLEVAVMVFMANLLG
jgi:hypothetical protein